MATSGDSCRADGDRLGRRSASWLRGVRDELDPPAGYRGRQRAAATRASRASLARLTAEPCGIRVTRCCEWAHLRSNQAAPTTTRVGLRRLWVAFPGVSLPPKSRPRRLHPSGNHLADAHEMHKRERVKRCTRARPRGGLGRFGRRAKTRETRRSGPPRHRDQPRCSKPSSATEEGANLRVEAVRVFERAHVAELRKHD
jgi:hypothetical protein